jgi:hypothetical protein
MNFTNSKQTNVWKQGGIKEGWQGPVTCKENFFSTPLTN